MPLVSDTQYPIQKRWIWKTFLAIPIYMYIFWVRMEDESVVASFVAMFLLTAVLYGITQWIMILRVHRFHYAFGDQFLHVEQGLMNKQQRNVPWGTIQNVIVKRDFLDRLMGLASLSIENAAQGGRGGNTSTSASTSFGFKGNRVSIPGLNVADAETLKLAVLNEVKAHPTDTLQSGL